MKRKLIANLKRIEVEVRRVQSAVNENITDAERYEINTARMGIFHEGMHRAKKSSRNKSNLNNLNLLIILAGLALMF
jgi:hypothetical protein